MQQTKSYWRIAAVAGVLGAFVASACVVTSSTDVDDSTAGSSGTHTSGGSGSSTAGTSSGGSGTSGSTGTSGSSSVAGTSSGGTGSTDVIGCDMGEAGAMTGTPFPNCKAVAGNPCSACLQSNCCAELEVCNGTNPLNQCGYGGIDNKGEFNCIAACMQKAFADNGDVELPEDLGTCGGKCGTDACSSVLGISTSILVECVHQKVNGCSAECFE
jgi:hypothetical protein